MSGSSSARLGLSEALRFLIKNKVEGLRVKHLNPTTAELKIEEVMEIITEAQAFAEGKQWHPSSPVFAANLFFEPSTRTKSSFEVAERELGLNVIP